MVKEYYLKIFQNIKNHTNKANQRETESIVCNQLSQLNDREQYFLGLMKKADTTNRSREVLLDLSYIIPYINSDILEIQQQRTRVKLQELVDSSEKEELKKIRKML
jgi:hypothetical protein